MHYYRFNIGNYNRRTSNLSNNEDLAYRRMLDKYYLDETPFPDDVAKIARLVGFRENPEIISDLLTDFFELVEGFWHNAQADEQIATYQALEKKNQENGKLGGRPRKETQNKPSGLPVASQSEPKEKANQEPVTKNQEPVNNKQDKIPYSAIAESYNINFAIPTGNSEVRPKELSPKRKKHSLWEST
jgi:uncharacterized protein YdaU (DUF1376 family)